MSSKVASSHQVQRTYNIMQGHNIMHVFLNIHKPTQKKQPLLCTQTYLYEQFHIIIYDSPEFTIAESYTGTCIMVKYMVAGTTPG